MPRRHSIEFIEAQEPVTELVTKFGGQPVWLTQPQWPLSRSTGRPMRFICQIAIDPLLFGETEAKMAYIFITAGDEHIDGTWEHDGGENAVILQPGNVTMPVVGLEQGPVLYSLVKKMFRKQPALQPCEFTIKTRTSTDPDYTPQKERILWSNVKWVEYAEKLDGNKIGGTPIFIENDEFPGPGNWKLLLELDSTRVPFHINFGNAGIGYAFISEDGKIGKFLWQCE